MQVGGIYQVVGTEGQSLALSLEENWRCSWGTEENSAVVLNIVLQLFDAPFIKAGVEGPMSFEKGWTSVTAQANGMWRKWCFVTYELRPHVTLPESKDFWQVLLEHQLWKLLLSPFTVPATDPTGKPWFGALVDSPSGLSLASLAQTPGL